MHAVAGRGLHIDKLPIVVNYDFPSRIEQCVLAQSRRRLACRRRRCCSGTHALRPRSTAGRYINRIGRTGRLDERGYAFSFFTRNMAPLASSMVQLLQASGQEVDAQLPALAEEYRQLTATAAEGGGAAAAAAALESEGEESDVFAAPLPQRKESDSDSSDSSDGDGDS